MATLTTPQSKGVTNNRANNDSNNHPWLWNYKRNKAVPAPALVIVDRTNVPFLSMSKMPSGYNEVKFRAQLAQLHSYAYNRFQTSSEVSSPTKISPRKLSPTSKIATESVTALSPVVAAPLSLPRFSAMKDIMMSSKGGGGLTKRACFVEDIFCCEAGDHVLLIIPSSNPRLLENYRAYANNNNIAYSVFSHGLDKSVSLQIPATVEKNPHGADVASPINFARIPTDADA
jgi:hypothetical protein